MKTVIIATFAAMVVSGCGGGSGGGGDCSGPQCNVLHFEELYTTAPPAVNISTGESSGYVIGGGTSPYSASSSDSKIVTSLVSGSTLRITGVSGGQGNIVVVDAAGNTVKLAVTVSTKEVQTNPPPTVFPASITIGDCTTNVPFTFTGGVGPFTVFTSDNFNAPVSAAQPLGQDNFFTASVKTPPVPYSNITLTVLDSQSRTATATIVPGSAHASQCPTNPLLQTFPASANARVSEKLSFQISGGIPPFSVSAINAPSAASDCCIQSIATVSQQPQLNALDQKYYFEVMANSTGSSTAATGAALITVTSGDGQKTNIVFTVFPRQ